MTLLSQLTQCGRVCLVEQPRHVLLHTSCLKVLRPLLRDDDTAALRESPELGEIVILPLLVLLHNALLDAELDQEALRVAKVLVVLVLRHADRLLLHVDKGSTDYPLPVLELELDRHADRIREQILLREQQVLDLRQVAGRSRLAELPPRVVALAR